MKKIYIKLIAMSMALVLSVTMVIMTSYAWLVLSGSPMATGIQVAVGGGNTILTAPDITLQTEDGEIYHYPGRFSDKLNFGQQSDYAYLNNIGNLTPVSTSNGVQWFIPDYYTSSDPEVQKGRALSGTLKNISDFVIDEKLEYANLDPEVQKDEQKISKGSYAYLDFWVVSPGGDYELRVSTGEENEAGGSFVIDLLMPKASGNTYVLDQTEASAAAAVRVGFLANDLTPVDDTMTHYLKSTSYDERFTSLRGVYREPGEAAYGDFNRFTIYEPNGDYHPTAKQNGYYQETKPLGLVNGQTMEFPVDRILTVQRHSIWSPAENGDGTAIAQRFKPELISVLSSVVEPDKLANLFYGTYLQGQISPFVSKGKFFTDTNALYRRLNSDGIVPATEIGRIEQSGATATDDIYIIRLERNVPQRIRMFIWLEGQDADCVDSVDSSRFAVNIELAGSDS